MCKLSDIVVCLCGCHSKNIFETEWLYIFKDLGGNLGGAISVFGVTIKCIYAYIYCRKSFYYVLFLLVINISHTKYFSACNSPVHG